MSLPQGRFGLIVADPPWTFQAWSDKGLGKSAQQHYRCMTLSDIMHLPIKGLAMPDCLLWLWATWPMLQQGIEVLSAWGFEYSTGGCWHKKTRHGKTQFGTGHRLRSACEPFLIGTIGAPETTRGVRNLVEARVREHSRKPDEAYAAAEALMPNVARLDLFAREPRPGWISWGDETDRFDPRRAHKLDPNRCPLTPDMFPEVV